MTTITLSLDKDTKRFELDDGPTHVHAGETVELVIRGLGVTAEEANGVNLLPASVSSSGSGDDQASAYPALRARLVHPVFGDLAIYPWPESAAAWVEEDAEEAGAGLKCQMDLDTEQLFRVVRTGGGNELTLYIERPWPESVPTVYGTYGLRVEDWPEATGEMRVFPAEGRYANAFAPIRSVGALPSDATNEQIISTVNAMLAAMKTLAQRNGAEEESDDDE